MKNRTRSYRVLLSLLPSERDVLVKWMHRHGETKLATAIRMRVMREAMVDEATWAHPMPENWTYAPSGPVVITPKPPLTKCPSCGGRLTFASKKLAITSTTKRGAIPVLTATITHAKPVCKAFPTIARLASKAVRV